MSVLKLGLTSGRVRIPAIALESAPLVVAVHGGTYDSEYFDVPDHSLLDRAEANGVPIVALDRPGYGKTPPLPAERMTLAAQGRFLVEALRDIWRLHGEGRPGIVVIGHSIGAAITLHAATDPEDVPLLGVAVSGLGMRSPPAEPPKWGAGPRVELVSMPDEVKDIVMFGPDGSYDAGAPARCRVANRPAPLVELIEIATRWSEMAGDVLGNVAVPVHYRQGEFDKLWIVNSEEVSAFAGALGRSPHVDAATLRGTGHCIDFHRMGVSFQLSQLGFALQCAARVA